MRNSSKHPATTKIHDGLPARVIFFLFFSRVFIHPYH